MKYSRLLLVPALFVLLAALNIGGCGGSNGEDFFNLDGFCRMRVLTNDFSDRAYFFDDTIREADLGVTSDSENLIITITDIPGFTILAEVNSDNNCTITGITDGETASAATGTCERQEDGKTFLIENLSALGSNFPLFQGECFDVFFFRFSTLDEISSSMNGNTTPAEGSEVTEIYENFVQSFDKLKNQ